MEKNINEYNKDIQTHGGYLYSQNKLSAKIATKKQSDEIIYLIKKYFHEKIKILDIGCGDGTFTMEIFKNIKPKLIVGMDGARKAIEAARKNIPKDAKKRIRYELGSTYNLKRYRKNKFDLIVIRGVLHHLYNPYNAVVELVGVSDSVIILEPNGYSPILKVIEKTSKYHMRHEEKSYYPFVLNSWFIKNGFYIKEKKSFGLVPYFCGNKIAKFLKTIEPVFEKIVFVRNFTCGSYIALYKSKSIDR